MPDIRYAPLLTSRDLFEKLKHDVARFDNDPNAYGLFDAMVTAWSLTDWLLVELPDPSPARNAMSHLAGKTTAKAAPDFSQLDQAMKICRDMAIGSKHADIRKRASQITEVNQVPPGFGRGRYGAGKFGVGEATYIVEVGGDQLNALNILRDIVALFDEFFVRYHL